MTNDVLLALLSLDSYNRGYGARISGLSVSGSIGDASILTDSTTKLGLATTSDASFYAIAYQIGTGANAETVISYRGTDKPSSDFWSYGIGAGDPSNLLGTSYGTTVGLTINFYKAVLNGADPFTANVTLTGHSLGGGLAGYVAGLYGQKAVIFDNMTFNDAVTLTQYVSANHPLLSFYANELQQLVYGSGPVAPVDFLKISAFATTGELLSVVLPARVLQTPRVDYLDSHGGVRRPDILHSMALLTLLKWNEVYGSDLWIPAGRQLWNAFFDEDVAKAITATDTRDAKPGGAADPTAVLDSAIAYSVIDSGERPFGDTAVLAMFNDASDLGKALATSDVSASLKVAAPYLAQILVEFAGKLALGSVLGGVGSRYADGVITGNGGDILTVDLSAATWAAGAAHTSIVGRSALVSRALSDLQVDVGPTDGTGPPPITAIRSDLLTGLKWLYPNNASDPTALIDRVVFKITNGAFAGTVPDREHPNSATDGLTLFASGGGADTITGSATADLIYGGEGSDFICGGVGNDLVAGGGGIDVLSGGLGNDFIAGGDGEDIYDLTFEGSSVTQAFKAFLGLVRPADGSDDRVMGSLAFAGAGGDVEDNRFLDIEKIQFGGGDDRLTVISPDFSDYASGFGDLVVDLGAGNDTVVYATRSAPTSGNNGIFYYDGATHAAGGGFGLAQNLIGSLGTTAMIVLLKLEKSLLPDDDLIVKGAENVTLTGENDRFYFSGSDYTVHSGFGKIEGGDGGDIIVYGGAKDGGSEALRLTIDGGTGNDWLYATGNKVTIFGGTGRDYIFNASRGGVIYGDTIDGVGAADSHDNADKIVFAPGVTLMDAGKYDQLVFSGGLRLTGGVDSGSRANGAVVYNDKLAFGMSYKQVGADLHISDRFSAGLRQLDGAAVQPGEDDFVVKNFSIANYSSGWGFAQFGIAC